MRLFARTLVVLVTIILGLEGTALGAEVRVAVASNFAGPVKAIAERFEAARGHAVVLSVASTGKLYAQIRNGAPFQVFLAADAERPRLLEEEGFGLPGSRFTYALGRLVLWSPAPGYVDPAGEVLAEGDFRHLAIANPRLAPYGRAARESLENLGLWQALQGRLVRGENIGQTFQFVQSGNAELGLVARSQVEQPGARMAGSRWDVPETLHAPIEQQAVLLADHGAARAFLAYLRGEEARALIHSYGYGTR
jgi:molybdate transport system substrate-binding protein